MPAYSRGGKTYFDLQWQGPRIFSQKKIPETVPRYAGVYLISSRRGFYDYPKGHSSLAYIGSSGDVGDRLNQHVGENKRVTAQLRGEGALRFWWARVGYGSHDCVEQVLFDDFEERHGKAPLINQIRPPCPRDHRTFVVRNWNLAFPHFFTTAEQFA